MNKRQLREKFFKECTDIPAGGSLPKVNHAPHDIFEWFYKNMMEQEQRFAEWTVVNGWEYFQMYGGWKHFKTGHQNGVYKTTEELFALYLKLPVAKPKDKSPTITIPKWQMDDIEDALRMTNNIYHCHERISAYHRSIMKAYEYALDALGKEVFFKRHKF